MKASWHRIVRYTTSYTTSETTPRHKMMLMTPCLALLLFVFGGEAMSFFALESHLTDLTNWPCRKNVCSKCFDYEKEQFCLTVSTLTPTGFYAVASANKHAFLISTVTAPGVTLTGAGYNNCWFFMEFKNVDPKQRSGIAIAEIECKGKGKAFNLGSFKIPLQTEEGIQTADEILKNGATTFESMILED